jgi:hypothetical protein
MRYARSAEPLQLAVGEASPFWTQLCANAPRLRDWMASNALNVLSGERRVAQALNRLVARMMAVQRKGE